MKIWRYLYVFLLQILSLLIFALSQIPDNNLHIIACDVGQGDATLVVHRNYQILVDGGPDNKVLDCLGKYLPFWEREIELIILTHPDKDHFQGLTGVLSRYKISNYLYNPVTISKPEYKVLEKEVGSWVTRGIHPDEGRVIRVGMIQLDILAPFGQSSSYNSRFSNENEIDEDKTNNYSIVSLVSFGKFRAVLTGDMTSAVSDELAEDWNRGPVNYIKIPHHGSKNGVTVNFLKSLRPNTATISVSKNNIYGHPHEEILDMLKNNGVKILRTDELGNIEVTVDGVKFR